MRCGVIALDRTRREKRDACVTRVFWAVPVTVMVNSAHGLLDPPGYV